MLKCDHSKTIVNLTTRELSVVKITKVYTKTGDQGETGLAGGARAVKFDTRIAAIGTLDELNAVLGIVVECLKESSDDFSDLIQQTQRIQNELFDLGAGLSVVDETIAYLTLKNVETLEHEIDNMNAHLSILHSFILPGGSRFAAQLHFARTVCRRTERDLVKLAQEAVIEKQCLPYINRLSDWLFVAARFVNHQLEIDEPLWKPAISA